MIKKIITLEDFAFCEKEVWRLNNLIIQIKRKHEYSKAFELCQPLEIELLKNKHLIMDYKNAAVNYDLSVHVNELLKESGIKLKRLAKAMFMTKQDLRRSILFGNNPQRLEEEIVKRIKEIYLKRGAIKNV